MERTFIVHSYLYWKYCGVNNISLWSFAIKHAVCLQNYLPNYRSGSTTLELITSNKADHAIWADHIFGDFLFLQMDPKQKMAKIYQSGIDTID